MKNFENKVVVVTGGTSGIGKATAVEFAQKGATVLITSRTLERAQTVAQEIGNGAKGYQANASNLSEVQNLANQIKEDYGRVDVLFVNAGLGKFAPLEYVDEAHYDEQFNILVKGSYFTVKHLVPLMPEGSQIIFNTSVVTQIGMPGASVYSAAKAAVQSLTKTLAAELIGKGIRVNAVSPGPIQTNFFNETGMDEAQIEGFASSVLQQVPVGRFGNPTEVAKVVSFLASEDSSFIVGTEVPVDGGMTQV